MSTDTEPDEETDSLEGESDKPRFTLQELRHVLQERNELKAEVFVLQEELAYYKRQVLFLKLILDELWHKVIQRLTVISSVSLSEEFEDEVSSIVCSPSPPPCSTPTDQQESGIRRL